jgi:hypothetical protein
MDQISPPMRIALVVAVIFAAAYMLVLKPKDEEAAPAPTPVTAPAADAGGPEASTGLGKAVESAHNAAAETEAAQQASSGEADTEAAAPTTQQTTPTDPDSAAPANPAEKSADESLAKLPQWLQDSMDKKVVAILFNDEESADDRRTTNALKRSYTGDHEVVHRAVPVAQISKYQGITEGLDVSQSPTLMIIARDRTAQARSGYSSLDSINQAIIDGLLATDDPAKTVPFLMTARTECKQISNRALVGVTEGTTPAGAEKNINASIDIINASLGTLRNAPVPAAYKDVKGLLVRYLASEVAVGHKMLGAVGGQTVNVIAVNKAAHGNDKLMNRALLELNAVGVDTCN